jgi:hypothetical protein
MYDIVGTLVSTCNLDIGMMIDARVALFIAMCVVVMQYNQIQCLKAKTGFHDASMHEYNNDAAKIKQQETHDASMHEYNNDAAKIKQQETNDICDGQPVTPLPCSNEEFDIRFVNGVLGAILDDLVQKRKHREHSRPRRDIYTMF